MQLTLGLGGTEQSLSKRQSASVLTVCIPRIKVHLIHHRFCRTLQVAHP